MGSAPQMDCNRLVHRPNTQPYPNHPTARYDPPPLLQCPQAVTLLLPLDADCNAPSVTLPAISLSDDRSGVESASAMLSRQGQADIPATVTVQDTALVWSAIPVLAAGEYEARVWARDRCDNESACVFRVWVWRDTVPAARCQSGLSVSLQTPDWSYALSATEVDDGSDTCQQQLPLRIARAGTDVFTNAITLDCSDLWDSVQVELRIYNVQAPDSASASLGSYSACTTYVWVTTADSLLSCTAPPDITVSCADFDLNNPDLFGQPAHPCFATLSGTDHDLSAYNAGCKQGLVTRIYTVSDSTGATAACAQQINVIPQQPPHYYIIFPDDVIHTDPLAPIPAPQVITDGGCGQFDISYSDALIISTPHSCYFIERTWTITNLCQTDPDAPCITVLNPEPNPLTLHPNNLPGPIVNACSSQFGPDATVISATPGATPTNYCSSWDPNARCYKYTAIARVIDNKPPIVAFETQKTVFDTLSANDPELWNANSFLDPITQSQDLFEEPVDIRIRVTKEHTVNSNFELLLDLNSDGFMESLLDFSLQNTAGSGNLYYGNIVPHLPPVAGQAPEF